MDIGFEAVRWSRILVRGSVLDEQIEANEQRQYREGWMHESDEYSVVGNEFHGEEALKQVDSSDERRGDEHRSRRDSTDDSTKDSMDWNAPWTPGGSLAPRNGSTGPLHGHTPASPGINPHAYTVAEMFVFSYGVAVFWNYTARQEKDVLADLTFSSTASHHMKYGSKGSPTMIMSPQVMSLPLTTRPLEETDFETEELHFQYHAGAPKPRIYNDMITLRTSDHMVKLAMSHAIAQSTKLSFFEERMQRTMAEAQYVPRRLALEGRLGLTRTEVVGLVGRLFEGRVDVNLSSNMLDTPTFFWDAEPTLHPLYAAVREYLEMRPRIQALNERCRVFLDLAEILSDSIADVKMTRITWIIIVLIVLSILVTCTEVFFALRHPGGKGARALAGESWGEWDRFGVVGVSGVCDVSAASGAVSDYAKVDGWIPSSTIDIASSPAFRRSHYTDLTR